MHLHHHVLHKYIEIHYDDDDDDNFFSLIIKANKTHYFSTLFW